MKAQANSFTRRRFLETTIVGSIPVVFSGVGNLSPVVTGQGSCLSRSRNWDYSRLSTAVLDHVGRELGRIHNERQSRGNVTANGARALASNVRLLFTHLNEAQFIRLLEHQVRECRQELLDFVPQKEHLQAIQKALASFGVSVTVEQLQTTLTLPYQDNVQILSKIERWGIIRFIKRGLGALNQVAKKLDRQTSEMMDLDNTTNLLAQCEPPPCSDICVCGVDCPPEDDEICADAAVCEELPEMIRMLNRGAAIAAVASFIAPLAAVVAGALWAMAIEGQAYYDENCRSSN